MAVNLFRVPSNIMENITTEICKGGIKVIRYNKPRKKNALDIKMYRAVTNILREVSADESINVVVLTGTGDFYSSGNDLTAAMDFEGNYASYLYPALQDFIRALIEFPKILVAIVNGPAIGIAATTLPLCDLVFASESSYFYTPFTQLGIVAEGCSSFTFSQIMGERKATEMLMFNYKMPAREALQCGFVNDLYKPEEIQNKVWDRIVDVTKLKIEALVECKKLLRDQVKDHLIELNEKELRIVRRMAFPSEKSKL